MGKKIKRVVNNSFKSVVLDLKKNKALFSDESNLKTTYDKVLKRYCYVHEGKDLEWKKFKYGSKRSVPFCYLNTYMNVDFMIFVKRVNEHIALKTDDGAITLRKSINCYLRTVCA